MTQIDDYETNIEKPFVEIMKILKSFDVTYKLNYNQRVLNADLVKDRIRLKVYGDGQIIVLPMNLVLDESSIGGFAADCAFAFKVSMLIRQVLPNNAAM